RDLLRAPRLVPAPVPGAGPPRHAVRAHRRRGSPLRRGRRPAALLAGFQRDEPLGVPARARQRHLLYAPLPRVSQATRGARHQRVRRVRHRDVESVTTLAAPSSGPAVSAGPRDQPPGPGGRGGAGVPVSGDRQAEHRRVGGGGRASRGGRAARGGLRSVRAAGGLSRAGRGVTMRFGYWLPVFGGWLRNVPDEGMEASWEYVRRLARRSEEIGFDVTLIAELNLNDIKGP